MSFVADNSPDDHDQTSGSKSLHLTFAPARARFLSLIVYPKGDFLLVDEIEVRSAKDGVAARRDLSKDQIRQEAARVRSSAALTKGGPIPHGAHAARRWAAPLPDSVQHSSTCDIRRVNPWDDFRSAHLDRLADTSVEKLVLPLGGVDQVAWLVMNHASTPAALDILQQKGLSVDALSFVQSANSSWIADAPTPFQSWMLPPRTAIILLGTIGSHEEHSVINLSCAGATFKSNIEIIRIDPAEDQKPLSGSLWPYLRGPAAPGACTRDLLGFSGADTAVIPPSALTLESGEKELRLYLRRFKGAKTIRLFMDLERPQWRADVFPPAQRKEALTRWWMRMKRIAREEGFTGELTPYPFDEIKPAHIRDLATFTSLFRVIDPSTRIFGTIDSPHAAEAFNHLDIVQILDRPENIRLARAGQETHLYATKRDARSLSPYAYYRLQGWKAYAHGFAGVGFWSLWETSGADDPESGWSLFGESERDYGALYRDLDGCPFASRRLHAWRRGLEDRRILKACETKFGKPALARLVEKVLANQYNTTAADEALVAVSARCGN